MADVGAAVEAEDGQIFTAASIGGYLSICAELGALSQLVGASTPTVCRVVAVWRNPDDAVLHVIPTCGRCREFIKTMSQRNLEATVILGPDHTATLRDLLPYPEWHAEPVHTHGPASSWSARSGPALHSDEAYIFICRGPRNIACSKPAAAMVASATLSSVQS